MSAVARVVDPGFDCRKSESLRRTGLAEGGYIQAEASLGELDPGRLKDPISNHSIAPSSLFSDK